MSKKFTKEITRRLTELGWTVTVCNNGHYRAIPPFASPKPLFISLTPSDHRAEMNIKGDIKRIYRQANLEVPKL